MTRIVLTTVGSWGDVFPFLGLGRELQRRGHDVVLAVNDGFGAYAEEAGLPWAPIGSPVALDDYADHPKMMRPERSTLGWRVGNLIGIRRVLRSFVAPRTASLLDDLVAACDGADLLIGHAMQATVPMAAERADVPFATFSLFPNMIPSASTDPYGSFWQEDASPARRVLNMARWRVVGALRRATVDGAVNDIRREAGAPPVPSAFSQGALSRRLVMVACSASYTPRPRDWAPHVVLTGFVTWDRSTALREDGGLAAFIDDGPAPVVVCLGSVGALLGSRFFDDAAGALTAAGFRVVLLTGADDPTVRMGDVFRCSYAPLSSLVPRAAALVHHGGLSTTVAALTNAVPSVVVPFDTTHDFNARRVEALGVGRRCPARSLRPAKLARAVRQVVGSDVVRQRLTEASAHLAAEDGAVLAADHVEACLAGRQLAPERL